MDTELEKLKVKAKVRVEEAKTDQERERSKQKRLDSEIGLEKLQELKELELIRERIIQLEIKKQEVTNIEKLANVELEKVRVEKIQKQIEQFEQKNPYKFAKKNQLYKGEEVYEM